VTAAGSSRWRWLRNPFRRRAAPAPASTEVDELTAADIAADEIAARLADPAPSFTRPAAEDREPDAAPGPPPPLVEFRGILTGVPVVEEPETQTRPAPA